MACRHNESNPVRIAITGAATGIRYVHWSNQSANGGLATWYAWVMSYSSFTGQPVNGRLSIRPAAWSATQVGQQSSWGFNHRSAGSGICCMLCLARLARHGTPTASFNQWSVVNGGPVVSGPMAVNNCSMPPQHNVGRLVRRHHNKVQ